MQGNPGTAPPQDMPGRVRSVSGRLTGGIPLRCATCRCMRSGRAWLTRDDPRRDRLPRPIIRAPDAPRGRRAAVVATSTTLRFAVLLVRFIEAGYTGLLERQANSHRQFGSVERLTVIFVVGAVIGAFATRVWGVHAMWLPAGFLALTLVLFMIDEAKGKEP